VGYVPLSSLIFVVIVAIWAAYLVQHWVRRREEAAAARSADGYTEAMRVLEKRPISPGTDVRTPDSYAALPAHDSRPAVDAKRAVPAEVARRHSPLVARRAGDHSAPTTAEVEAAYPEPSPTAPAQQADSGPNPVEVHPMPVAQRTAGPVRDTDPSDRRMPRGSRPAHPKPRISKAQRLLRAGLLLSTLLWVPVSVVLAVTGALMWVSVLFSVVTVLAVLVWLRTEAQSDRVRALTVDRARRRQPRRETAAGEYSEEVAPPLLSSEVTQVIHSTATEVSREEASQSGRRSVAVAAHDVVFDVQAQAVASVPVVTPAEDLPPGSWSPVPVPKPTYTLKAKAEPRYTETGVPADVFDTPEFAEEAEELDERARFARRAASQ
jgi:hypothetical protein